MLSVFLPLGIHSNEEHLLKHLEVPRSTSSMGSLHGAWLKPPRTSQGLGRQKHQHLGGSASELQSHAGHHQKLCRGLLCWEVYSPGWVTRELAHHTTPFNEKIQFTCRPRGTGRKTQPTTIRKSSFNKTQIFHRGMLTAEYFLIKLREEVQGDGMVALKMYRWKDGCLPEMDFIASRWPENY